jgi:very-short-patch-repair endonuclease
MQSGPEYGSPDDSRLAAFALAHHGIVAREQLTALGYSKHAIQTRTARGRLLRRHRGVYAVGHTKLSRRGHWLAAVLACGPDAVLSHRAAAALWELRGWSSGPIDVTATRRHNPAGVRCHKVRNLPPEQITIVDAIPVTTIDRTLLDLAEILSPQQLRSVLETAQRAAILNVRQLRTLMARSPGRHGLKPLADALATLQDEVPWTQSELERRFLELIRDAGLPAPSCNVVVDGETVDFYWPDHNLIVEIDGFRYHRTRQRFEDDRRRDTKHAIAGRRSVRFTHQRIAHDQKRLINDLGRLLSG